MSTPAVVTAPLSSYRTALQRWLRRIFIALLGVIILAALAVVGGRIWIQSAMRKALPMLDGSLQVQGLQAEVRVERDEHGIPHVIASNMDDLVFAQGYVTAQDRLWQMDILRRHAAGDLAEILGKGLVSHDKLQRYLQLRATAEHAIQQIDPSQRHAMEVYALGVNAFINSHRSTLPAEFRVLGYEPAPWQARDSLLIGYAMAQDLSTSFQDKLNREFVSSRLSPDLQADLYPVGSWRDHPPAEGMPDLKAPTPFEEIPLDESQAFLRTPEHTAELQKVVATLAPFVSHYRCADCAAGSNNWAVSGAHTANGHSLLSNDPHLSLSIPSIWYEANLEAGSFHAAGVSLPGMPFLLIGHNQHIAWGFTNSGADVQDLYIETVDHDRYRAADGSWHSLEHAVETIHVRSGSDVKLDIAFTQHGAARTPIISPLYPSEKRQLALRWVLYDTAEIDVPFEKVNAASNWDEFLDAFAHFQGASQNAVYADDQGHIGYHMIGRVPLRGDITHPSGISPVPTSAGSYEWVGYIPFSDLPQVFDPPSGILATANARITPDGYPYAIALDWEAPYRNERIWKVLNNGEKLTPADMLALQDDTVSEFDQTLAQRIAYAVDHAHAPSKRARQAADLLRAWDGNVTTETAAPNLVTAATDALWPMLLQPHLGDSWKLYTWKERTYVMEEMVTHAPVRWLPREYSDWNEFLTAALERGLNEKHAPSDLAAWRWGKTNKVNIAHPLFGITSFVNRLVGMHTGTGEWSVPGNRRTVRVAEGKHGASNRFTVDPADPEHAWLNIVTGESGNPASPYYLDQFSMWVNGKTMPLVFSSNGNAAHTLMLRP